MNTEKEATMSDETTPEEVPAERKVPMHIIPDGASLLAPALYTTSAYLTLDDEHATVFFMQSPTILSTLPGLREAVDAAAPMIASNPTEARITLQVPVVAKVTMTRGQLEKLRGLIDEVLSKHELKKGTTMVVTNPEVFGGE